jgi:hypothetical protein
MRYSGFKYLMTDVTQGASVPPISSVAIHIQPLSGLEQTDLPLFWSKITSIRKYLNPDRG